MSTICVNPGLMEYYGLACNPLNELAVLLMTFGGFSCHGWDLMKGLT